MTNSENGGLNRQTSGKNICEDMDVYEEERLFEFLY